MAENRERLYEAIMQREGKEAFMLATAVVATAMILSKQNIGMAPSELIQTAMSAAEEFMIQIEVTIEEAEKYEADKEDEEE